MTPGAAQTPYVSDVDFTLYVGDAVEVLRGLPPDSVDCVVTSPPYFQQRDYANPGQIGNEETPAEYVARIVAVFTALRRVLKPRGTAWLNIDDTYAANRSYQVSQSKHQTHDYGDSNAARVPDGMKPKDLMFIPHTVAMAIRDSGWWARSENIWWKPNALPESAKDRPHRGHEFVFQFALSAHYDYDAEAVKQPAAWEKWGAQIPRKTADANARGAQFVKDRSRQELLEIAGERNLRSVWAINTQPFPDAHFAVFPEELPRDCIRAGCPKGGVVLDPFMGSGTTAVVARKLGRRSIGIELNEQYAEMAARRLGQQSLLAELAS